MNRALTFVTLFLALAAVAAAISLRSCLPSRGGQDGFVMDLKPPAVRAIRIQSTGEMMELKRKGAAWQFISGDLKDAGNSQAAEEILKAASLLMYYDRIPASEIQGRDHLSEFGLRSPKRWIEFLGTHPAKLFFGKDAAFEDRMYARLDGSNDVYLIDKSLNVLVDSEPAKFRDTVLVGMSPAQVDRVIIRGSKGGETEIVRSAAGWNIVKPLAAPADEAFVERFLKSLLGIPVLAIVANDSGDLGVHGIQEGKYEISFFVEGRQTPLVIRFGHLPKAWPETVLAQFTGRDIIARLPVLSRKLLDVEPDDLRDRRLLPVDGDIVDLIRVTDGDGQRFDIRRSPDGWQTLRNGTLYPVSGAAVETLLSALAQTRVSGFVGREPVPITRTIEFLSVLSENTPEATAGEQLVAGVVFGPAGEGGLEARILGRAGGVIVPTTILQAIPPDQAAWCLPVAPPAAE
ncbi:MAG: DUF4340 domain-containing protein [Terrimicrobiaceae bacterium]